MQFDEAGGGYGGYGGYYGSTTRGRRWYDSPYGGW